MFSDINGFAATSSHLGPHELVEWMTYIFSVMDAAAEHYQVYKIKTIGDAYFAISGLLGFAHDGFVDTDGHTMRMYVSDVSVRHWVDIVHQQFAVMQLRCVSQIYVSTYLLMHVLFPRHSRMLEYCVS